MIPFLALGWASPTSFATPCTTGELQASVSEAAEAPRQTGDVATAVFREALRNALQTLDCLTEPITPSVAADLHFVKGLEAFLDGDPEAAERAFRAVREVDPSYTLDATLWPEGHPLRVQFDGATPSHDRTKPSTTGDNGVRLLTSAGPEEVSFDGAWSVDGAALSAPYLVPSDRPFLLQNADTNRAFYVIFLPAPSASRPNTTGSTPRPLARTSALPTALKAAGSVVALSGAAAVVGSNVWWRGSRKDTFTISANGIEPPSVEEGNTFKNVRTLNIIGVAVAGLGAAGLATGFALEAPPGGGVHVRWRKEL